MTAGLVDRYITADVRLTAHALFEQDASWTEIFRAVLPRILARHRADVLREVFSGDRLETAYVRAGIRDEAVAE